MLLMILLASIEVIIRIYELNLDTCDWINNDVFQDNKELASQICKDLGLIEYDYGDEFHTFTPDQHMPTVNINSYGFRGDEISKEKPLNTFRIFIVGGSTSASLGSSSDQTTISGYLQQYLKEINQNIEVINAGVGGSFSYEEAKYVKNYLINFEPDLIIVYDSANDARYRILEDAAPYKKDYGVGPFKLSEISNYYHTPFVLYHEFLKPTFFNVLNIDNEISEKIAKKWKDRWLNVCEFGNLHDFKTIIVIQPMLFTGNKILTVDESKIEDYTGNKFQTKKIIEQIIDESQYLEKECTGVYDFTNTFDMIEEPIFFDDVHITDFGNDLIAKKLYKKILPIIAETHN
tara:strand:- start:4878 stop:5918 length:1041 start_codon:yes stop_codon:yes gene_type:complete